MTHSHWRRHWRRPHFHQREDNNLVKRHSHGYSSEEEEVAHRKEFKPEDLREPVRREAAAGPDHHLQARQVQAASATVIQIVREDGSPITQLTVTALPTTVSNSELGVVTVSEPSGAPAALSTVPISVAVGKTDESSSHAPSGASATINSPTPTETSSAPSDTQSDPLSPPGTTDTAPTSVSPSQTPPTDIPSTDLSSVLPEVPSSVPVSTFPPIVSPSRSSSFHVSQVPLIPPTTTHEHLTSTFPLSSTLPSTAISIPLTTSIFSRTAILSSISTSSSILTSTSILPSTTSTSTSTTSSSTTSSEASTTTSSETPNTGGREGWGGPTDGGSPVSPTSPAGIPDSDDSTGIPTPKIVGGVLGGVAGAALLLILIFLLLRLRRRRLLGSGTERSAENAGRSMSEAPLIAAVVAGASKILDRFRASSQSFVSSAATGEKGFQKLGGRKLQSVLETGGDGYDDKFGVSSNENPFADPVEGSLAKEIAVSSFSPVAAARGARQRQTLHDVGDMGSSQSFPSPPLGRTASQESDKSAKVVVRPSPARTPITSSTDLPASASISATPGSALAPAPAPCGPLPPVPMLHAPRSADGIGRSHPGADDSRTSRFTEAL
ncbi:hypothetical protein VTO42DRAFT_8656 [Malbranchea cinnamomea]